ncbi:MAG: hypothetical protein JNL97_11560, partial [Verrucomicrobiales bacterium]|nr:hypothetical protein [Verrucomicrobiales bacterium]
PSNPVVRPPVALPGSFRGLSHEGALVYTLATRTDAPADANATSRTWLEAAAYDGTAAHWVAGLDVANLSKGDSASVEITPDGSVWLAQTTDSGKSHALSLLRVSDTAKFEKRATLALDAAVQSLDHVGDVATISFGSQVRLFRVADGPSIAPVGQAFDLGCLLQGLHRLSGGPETGYWAPLGDYGSAPLP